MNAKASELRPIVSRFATDADKVDPCGPSPVLIGLPLLRKLTPEWLRLSFELKRDQRECHVTNHRILEPCSLEPEVDQVPRVCTCVSRP